MTDRMQLPVRRSLGRDGVVRTRVMTGFETVGHAIGEAQAFRNTVAFFAAGTRRKA